MKAGHTRASMAEGTQIIMKDPMTIVTLLLIAALPAAAQLPPPTTVAARQVDPAVASFMKLAEPASEDDPVQLKLKERHNTAVRLLELHIERYRNGVADSSAVFASAKDVADAKMELARTPAEREAAARQMVDVTRSVEARMEKQWEAGLGVELSVLRARLARETAEIELLKLRRPGTTAPTTQPQ